MSQKDTNQYYITRQDSTESNARSYPRKFPFALAKAKGSWVEDVEGNKYLDFLCGAGTLALGHNDDEVNQAMVEMLTNNSPLHTLDLTTPVKDTFVHTLLSLLPPELGNNAKIQFCSPSGTDATDAAIKLCKCATGRSSVISFAGGYHGMGQGPLACMGNLHAKSSINGLMPDVHSFPYPYPYRDPFGLGGENSIKAACNFFERTLKDPESGISKPACVILEAIQGEGGVIPAPVEFLKTVRRVTKELDIPLILDEIQCGMGRSGKLFAFEYADIIPDVVSAGLNTVAIRMPESKIARDLIDASKLPIAAPSANLSGKPSPTTWQHVNDDMNGRIDAILIGPDSKVGIESTVVDMTGDTPMILRPGIITKEVLKRNI